MTISFGFDIVRTTYRPVVTVFRDDPTYCQDGETIDTAPAYLGVERWDEIACMVTTGPDRGTILPGTPRCVAYATVGSTHADLDGDRWVPTVGAYTGWDAADAADELGLSEDAIQELDWEGAAIEFA